ncbi:autotransporter outer membrane beta-barrel domain-containing protein [Escherichia coli]|uniref:autotransporter outer membrane beta-barrel domain-containing protein n=1 Tax=Escherichia coli TaxID=562 RepID=UPI000B50993D|nr:autotransporter outer membrane beta-barrel domain-containing protein [Escherichia coli]
MNRIYSLKYCVITGGMIAVSEIARKVVKKSGRKLPFSMAYIFFPVLLTGTVDAAQLHTNNIWIRDYLDLAQNKGVFHAGATDVKITLKNGQVFEFPKVEIPDFSPASNKGTTTSIGGAYSVTATHSAPTHHAISTQSWAQSNYKYVDRMTKGDFAVTRLDKFVVETEGLTDYVNFNLNSAQALERYGVEFNGKKQIIGFRAGSGVTSIVQNGVYQTGQGFKPELLSATMFQLNWNNKHVNSNTAGFFNETTSGDSGSGYYLYDNVKKKWVILGTHTGIAYGTNDSWAIFAHYDNNLVNNLKNYFAQNIGLNGEVMTFNGSSFVINGVQSDVEITANKKSKDLVLSGGGIINLTQNMNLGIGGLIFDEGQYYRINGEEKSYKGAGLDIGAETTVDWNIKGVINDNLHKIGAGTLNVNVAQGNRLKTGDGTVMLNAEKAFNAIYMASGRGVVRLGHENALDKSNDYLGIYFTEGGGTLDLNGYNQTFKKIAATDSGAVITNSSNKMSVLSIQNDNRYMYHGTVTGNTSITHSFEAYKDNSRLILDGNVAIAGDLNIKNSQLTLQGHATTHAVFREGALNCPIPGVICDKDYAKDFANLESTVNKNNGTEYKSNNQVASFDQPDWQNRLFSFHYINLENAEFTAARNSIVNGDIEANQSMIKLGGNAPVYIDMHDGKNITDDGFGFRQDIKEGYTAETGASYFTGNISLNNQSSLDIGKGSWFSGGITAWDSSVTVSSENAVVDESSWLVNSTLTVKDGGHLIVQNGLSTVGSLDVEQGTLSLTGKPVTGSPNTYSPDIYFAHEGYRLQGDAASFEAYKQASVTGDIIADGTANITLGSAEAAVQSPTPWNTQAVSMLAGYDAALNGSVSAAKADMKMSNSLWEMRSNSTIGKLSTDNSRITIKTTKGFNTLSVGELNANNSDFILRTDLKSSDKIVVDGHANGQNNAVYVNYMKKPADGSGLNIPLITTAKNSAADIFKAGTYVEGFSQITPQLRVDNVDGGTQWVLNGFKVVADKESTRKAGSFMDSGYKGFLNEANNLNKRMGELRDTGGEAGVWARIMNGTGSADGGYNEHYTHLQIGADRKHHLNGADVFTGITLTYTDSATGSQAFSGDSKSFGGGLYASTLFDSGAYIDVIGKYVHHRNEYTGNFAGFGTRSYNTHSLYAGLEVGYRYHMTESTFIEPQAELIYGSVRGKTFRWQDGEMDLSMKKKDSTPLIGRTGLAFGKTFSGEDWSVTARAGAGWQFDMLRGGDTFLQDASGEKRLKGEKDSRALFNVGLNAQLKDNMRFGLELEKSAFGKYNIDNSVNATFRYSF